MDNQRPSYQPQPITQTELRGGLKIRTPSDLLPGCHRAGGTELVADADVDDVPAPGDQAILEGLKVAAEFPDPEPGFARGRLRRDLQRHGLPVDGEFLDRGGGGAGAQGQSEQREENTGGGEGHSQNQGYLGSAVSDRGLASDQDEPEAGVDQPSDQSAEVRRHQRPWPAAA